jgi:hypothetical protein
MKPGSIFLSVLQKSRLPRFDSIRFDDRKGREHMYGTPVRAVSLFVLPSVFDDFRIWDVFFSLKNRVSGAAMISERDLEETGQSSITPKPKNIICIARLLQTPLLCALTTV